MVQNVPSKSISSTLLHRLRCSDQDAFVRLQSLFHQTVTSRLSRMEVLSSDLEDLEQEVFLRVWKGVARFRRDQPDQSFRRWLLTIVRNVAIDYFNQPQRFSAESGVLTNIPNESETAAARSEELAYELHQMLETVRSDFNEVTFELFLRFWFDGHDTDQLALEYKMKKGTIREARSRVLRRLREEFGDIYGESDWPFGSRNSVLT